MPAVVSDKSVLHYLHYLAVMGQFDCLPKIFGTVVVPPAVWKEMTFRPELMVHTWATNAIADRWLGTETPGDRRAVQSLRDFLGAGESEAIILAQEYHPSLLLMDDLDGRNMARRMKLTVTGTIGVLVRAHKLGHVARLKPVFDELITKHRFRLNKMLYADALREVGESE